MGKDTPTKPEIPEITDAELEEAARIGELRERTEPRAKRVSYDARKRMLQIELRGGVVVAIPIGAISEFAGATPKQLRSVHVDFHGEAISQRELDVDISVPGLLRDFIGVKTAASILGKIGGSATSDAKTAAVRRNGRRGGRPRKPSLTSG